MQTNHNELPVAEFIIIGRIFWDELLAIVLKKTTNFALKYSESKIKFRIFGLEKAF